MSGLKFTAFAGVIPRLSSRLLDQRNAETADNLKAFSGELRSWKRPLQVAVPTKIGTVQTIFRYNNGTTDFWLNWLSDVNVVPGPLAGDATKRLYYTGDNSPKKTNLAMATAGPDYPTASYEMGIPAPAAPVAAVGVAGAAPNSQRNYVVTFVNAWGEEGPPSAVSNAVTFGATGFTINLSGIDTGTRAVAITRVGQVATVVLAAHGFYNNSLVTHAGAAQAEYNVTAQITVIDANSYSFVVGGAPATPATGAPVATGNYGIAKRRIYRTNVTSSGVATLQLLTELADITTTVFVDIVLDAALGVVIPSTLLGTTGSSWVQPPETMKGLIELPNGGMAGHSGNTVHFCEPNNPHAWPTRYQQTFPYEVTGIQPFGNTVVVGTHGLPYTLTGTHPENMSSAIVEDFKESCRSKRGMVAGPGGVYYPSSNGLVNGGLSGFDVVTRGYFDRDTWQAQVFPDTLIAAVYDGRYYGFFSTGTNQGKGFILPKDGDAPGILFNNQFTTAAYVDKESGNLYLVQDGVIKQWDADPNNLLPFTWLSKKVITPGQVSIGCFDIDADFAQLDDAIAQAAAIAADTAYNIPILASGITGGEVNSAALDEFDLNGSSLHGGQLPNFDQRYLLFQVFAEVEDGSGGITTREYDVLVTTKGQNRIPGGFKSDTWQYGMTGNIPVFSLKVGEVPKDLKAL